MKNSQFPMFQDWRKQFGHFFGEEFWNGFEPLLQNNQTQMNLYKGENEILVVLAIPGLENVEEVDVYAHYQTLEIRGEVNLNFRGFELQEEGIFQGRFERVVQLPYPVREDKVEASYHHGLLMIHLHRLISESNKRKIAVKRIDD